MKRYIWLVLVLAACDSGGGVGPGGDPVEPYPVPGPEFRFLTVEPDYRSHNTAAFVVVRNEGGSGVYKLHFYVPDAMGADSMSRETFTRLVWGSVADTGNWLVSHTPKPIRRVEALQRATSDSVWTVSDVNYPHGKPTPVGGEG